MHNMFANTGFDVQSMLTVPLSGDRCVGAVQVLNKEPIRDNFNCEFSLEDLKTLEEMAEYVGPLIQKLVDAEYQMSPSCRKI